MQWSDKPNGGFTTAAKPWLAINPNYRQINAAQELTDPSSIYHYTQRLIALRHNTPALIYGDYKDLDPTHTQIFAYTRTLSEAGKPAEHYLILLNMSKTALTYTLPAGMKSGKLILANSTTTEANTTTLHLTPWESRIYKY